VTGNGAPEDNRTPPSHEGGQNIPATERSIVVVNEQLFRLKGGVTVEEFVAKKKAQGKDVQVVELPRPDYDQLAAWMQDGEAETTDGCIVEPDGTCEHGHHSWLRVLGMI
jgi:hypothetical protein